MKNLLAKFMISCALVSMLSFNVEAADDDIDVLEAPESTFVEFGSGWYLRGDIAATVNGSRQVYVYSDATTNYDVDFRDMMNYGVGAGYRFNKNLRVDGTLTHMLFGTAESFRQYTDAQAGSVVNGVAQGSCAGYEETSTGDIRDTIIQNCSEYDRSQYDTFLLMGSAYLELDPIGKFQPFIGAGVGVARVRWSQIENGSVCSPVPESVSLQGCYGQSGQDQPEPNSVYTSSGTTTSGVDYRLAYQFTAGLSYQVNEKLFLEGSYKYVGVAHRNGIASGDNKSQDLAKNGFGVHQVNLGIRYEIW